MKILGKLLQQKLYSGLKGFFCIPKLKTADLWEQDTKFTNRSSIWTESSKTVRLPHSSVHGLDQVEQI